jgi:hypothetical protein
MFMMFTLKSFRGHIVPGLVPGVFACPSHQHLALLTVTSLGSAQLGNGGQREHKNSHIWEPFTKLIRPQI